MKLNNAQLLAMVTGGDERYFFTRLNFEDFTYHDVKVHLKDLQALGVAKTIRSDKRVSAFYDSEAGLNWLEQNYNTLDRV